MKKRPARATAYLTVALLVLVALRYTPELPDTPAAGVLQQGTPVAVADFVAPPAVASRTEKLNRGETLIGLFKRVGISDESAKEIVRAATSTAIEPRYLQAGMPVEFTGDSAGTEPKELVFHLGIDRLLRMRHSAQGWVGTEERLPWQTDTVVVGGTINSNLYQAMDASASQYFPARSKDELTWALADIFEYRVDMSRDLQVGDQFRALVERSVGPGGDHEGRQGARGVVHPLGQRDLRRSLRQQAAARSTMTRRAAPCAPPSCAPRSSSVASPAPSATASTRSLAAGSPHKGTDYAAAPGTPVRAIGDAVVVRAGWGGGYGNVLELRHRNGYVTRYGHLRGFAKGIRPGVRVNIAQTVAYVGTTGLSTGPHLHFEVLINGVQRDSRVALKSVAGDPILRSEKAAFDARREQLLASLSGAPGVVRLASR